MTTMGIGYHAALLLLVSVPYQPIPTDASMLRFAQNPDPVKVLVLTEALCPGCKHFIQTTLVQAFDQLGPTVMNLTVIPYGNAEITDASKHQVVCQHGVRECDANVWELCAIDNYPNVEQHFPYLECLARQVPEGPLNETICPCTFKQCALENHLWFPAIQECHEKHAWEMLDAADKATPDHDYVPWIIVDDKHIESEGDLVAVVCDIYQQKGGTYPACTQHVAKPSLEPVPTCPHGNIASPKI